jgi:SAM-dependent methyltransferase
MRPIFIDKNINVTTDTNALSLLNTKNDKAFLKDNEIIQTSQDRWDEAQQYEYRTWMINGLGYSDDRNYDHNKLFDEYHQVPWGQIKNFIELGCGPFTNTRLIIDKLPKNCTINLLDPLIEKYVSHPNCTYKNYTMCNRSIKLITSPIETCNIEDKFDCILMNNVLEHCFDINTIFKKIISMLDKNGIFIFSDVYFLKSDIVMLSENTYDAGHPLRISKDTLESFLKTNFITLYEKDYTGLYNQFWRNDKYYIGQKI